MVYILGLFIILALIFSSMSGSNIVSSFLGQIKDSVSATIFPKTEREIVIDNLNSNYQYLDKFFSESAPKILGSRSVSENEKIEVKKAMETFNSSKDLMSNLSKIEKEDNGPLKTMGTILERVINFTNNNSTSTNTTESAPTSIPPQCRLECSE